PLADNGTLTIYREIPFTQESDYVEDDPLPADQLESDLDRAAMRDQQLQDGQNRALTFPVTVDPNVSGELPIPVANEFLRWNGAADALENADINDVSAVGFPFAGGVFADGVAATPVAFEADANTGIFRPAADTFAISTGGVEAIRWTSAQITQLAAALQVAAGTAGAPGLSFTADPDTGVFRAAADALGFATGGVEAMRVDSSRRWLLGYTEVLTSQGYLGNIIGTGTDAGLLVGKFAADSAAPRIVFVKSRGATPNTLGIVQSGDAGGIIRWFFDDGTDYQTEGARIGAEVDGTPGANDMPTRLVLSTTADGANSVTERLRIDNAGALIHRNNATTIVHASSHLGLRSYTVATLPSASPAGQMIYVSDGTGNKRQAVSDGTNWRFPDGNIVS
ncbi:MAG TPA: hypothetical protein VFF65_12645, partial [Phycisphaerales bacterium]|nr:hypothetical protein [Phycisphaerales bacterium]